MTILKNQFGLSLTYDLTISGVPVNYQSIDNVELSLEENMHDCLKLTYKGIHPKAITEYANAPVRMVMETGPGYSQLFTGHISLIKPVAKTAGGLVNNSPFQVAELTCFGASYEMRGAKSHVWGSATLAEVAVALAKRYGFSVDVPTDPLVISNSMQTNESDWQFLVRYAKSLGYVVTCHGTHLHIFDPYKARDRQRSVHKLITARAVAGGRIVPGIIASFEGEFLQVNPDGEYMDNVVTVIYDSGTMFDVSTSDVLKKPAPASFSQRLLDDVDSYAEAERVVAQSNKEKYDFNAHVVAAGMAGCVPGGIVHLDQYTGNFDGWWYVRSVTHKANTSRFISELEIGRNKINHLDVNTGTAFYTSPPASVYLNGQFRSAKAYHNVY